MKKVYIIIVTYKSMKWIKTCLNSLRQSDYPLNIVIVDNNSNDDSIEYLSQQPDIHMILNNKNHGFGQANNQGIKYAITQGADYCFLLNQDAYIYPDTIKKLIETTTLYPNAGIITPVHLNGSGDGVDAYFRDYVLAKNVQYLTDTMFNNLHRNYDVINVPAAAWFLPIKTILEIGGFDPLFFHYGEDDNYLQRLKYHHRTIIMDTTAFIRHDRKNTVGNQQVYNKGLNYRNLMGLCTNINLDIGFICQKSGRMLYDDFGLLLMYLFSGRWSMIHNFIFDYIRIISQIHKIKRSRKFNKKLNANWLNCTF